MWNGLPGRICGSFSRQAVAEWLLPSPEDRSWCDLLWGTRPSQSWCPCTCPVHSNKKVGVHFNTDNNLVMWNSWDQGVGAWNIMNFAVWWIFKVSRDILPRVCCFIYGIDSACPTHDAGEKTYETRRVVISDSLCISKCLQNRIWHDQQVLDFLDVSCHGSDVSQVSHDNLWSLCLPCSTLTWMGKQT